MLGLVPSRPRRGANRTPAGRRRRSLGQPPVNTRARFNVCPTTPIDTILDQDGKRRLERMRWDLVPSWWSKPLKEMKETWVWTR